MFRIIAIILLVSGLLLALWFLFFGGYFNGDVLSPNSDKAKTAQPFFTGLVVPLLTLGSTLLVFENLRNTSRQNFSNNFLKLIDQHHKLVDNIQTDVDEISSPEAPSKGRAFFDDLAERIATDYYKKNEEKGKDNADIAQNTPYDFEQEVAKKTGLEKLMYIYDYYFHIYHSDLSHYFRNLYNIIRYAENSGGSKKTIIQHIKILRAQLSNYEILLLAYNGLHPYGAKFYRLIEKFELLNPLNTEDRLSPNRIRRIIDLDILTTEYPALKKRQIENES